MQRILGVVKGRVQGVGFRYFTHNLAADHNLSGWVRNRSDGLVEFEIQGKDTEVDRFIERVKQAKYPAKVTDLHLTELEVDESSDSFQIIK